MQSKRLGVFPTMITPYTAENEVDYAGVRALVKWYWKKGCDGIFAVCQSSEIHQLSLSERVKIAETVIAEAKSLAEKDKSRKPMTIVVSGHISDEFSAQVEELTAMAGTGADALIMISNRLDIANTSEENWIADLHALIEKLPKDIPLGLYECPRPYKRLLSKKMLEACVATGRFAFIKDTCCDASVIKQRVEWLKGSDIGLYNANAQTFLQSIRDGGDGYCGVMANMHPELYSWVFKNMDDPKADFVQAALAMAAFTESLAYPATAKYYLAKYEGIDILPDSRVVDYKLVTEYQEGCLAQMKLLLDGVKQSLE